MDHLNDLGKLDEQDIQWHQNHCKVSNGARRKQQRQNKQAREEANRKRKAQEEERETLAREKEKSKKSKHGRRSSNSLLKAIGRRLGRWVKDETISGKRILYIDDEILQQFENGKVDGRIVTQSIQDLPQDPQLLRRAPEDGVFVLRRESQMPQTVQEQPSSVDTSISDHDSISESSPDNSSFTSDQTQQPAATPQQLPWEPRFSAIRLTNIMSEEAESLIVNAVDRMYTRGVNMPRGCRRSNITAAHHVGIWSKFWLTVYATADTLSQNMGVQEDMDSLFKLIAEHVNQPIMEFLEEADPDYAKTLKRINKYVQMALDDEFIDPPFKHLRSLGPLFSVFAMKYGGSEISHLDLGDVPGLYAIIVVLDDFQGGDFCLPHLGYCIPLHRRSVLLVDARWLVHSTGSWTGFRFVITGFIDYNTAFHAGIKTAEFFELSDEEFELWMEGRVFDEHARVSKKSRKMGRSKPKASRSHQGSSLPVPLRKSHKKVVGELLATFFTTPISS
ncbi:hypothetical protein FS837_012424 [Tulasnella sp. UAMH 9824]|nr:hypothetical protein FS837_012424 [Tulasnella sp. UAMH 9824]